MFSSSGDDARLRSLEATAKTKHAELDRLQKQLEDNKTVVVTKTVPIEARIVTQARPSSLPTFPKKMPFSFLAMAGSFLIGLAWIVTRELLVGARASTGSTGGTEPHRPVPPSLGGIEPALGRVAAAFRPSAALAATAASGSVAAGGGVTRLTSIDGIANRLVEASTGQAGFRSMVAPESRLVDATAEATALVSALAQAGKQVVLVDWDLEGAGGSQALGVPEQPGMTDLLQGNATFEDVISRLPGSDAHFIACGGALTDVAVGADADRINLVLDALDEAYDHIVVIGNHDAARELFEIIEGRFDAGITVAEARRRQPVIEAEPDNFLGFEVRDLDVIRFERAAVAVAGVAGRRGAAGHAVVADASGARALVSNA